MSPTLRLMVAFGAGLVALFYLTFVISLVANRGIEFSATRVEIEALEAGADPEASYLEVEGGVLVFPLARPTLRRLRGDGDEGRRADLRFLSVPVVSPGLWSRWQQSLERGEQVDAATCRLIVSFNGEQVAALWPEVKRSLEAEEELPLTAPQHLVIGDTESAAHQIGMPLSTSNALGVAPDEIRWMRHEQHLHGLGNLVKHLLIAAGLAGLSLIMFYSYRRTGDPSPPGGVSAVEVIDALETSDLI